MKKIAEIIHKKTSVKRILLLFAMSQTIFIIMKLYTFPIIEVNSGNIKAPDLSPLGYTHDHIVKFLNSLSSNSRMTYLFIQEPLDILYPLILGCFFAFAFSFLTNSSKKWILIGFLTTIFDYLENICVTSFLITMNPSKTLVTISSVFTILKSVTTTLCFLLLLFLISKKSLFYLRSTK